MLALEPLFVDRAAELDEFAALLQDLTKGRRRHIALMGLRRIGKTMLLDEVRRRHPLAGIAYMALDELVVTPEDFAQAMMVETIAAASVARGRGRPRGETQEELRSAVAQLHPDLIPVLGSLFDLIRLGPGYSSLLKATMRFPAQVSQALDLPLLWMIDEFQEIVRLEAFPDTGNLLGTIRAALDRPGKVAFTVAGSRVNTLRSLLGNSESPLFTRFEQMELHPFDPLATAELAALLWDEDELAYDPDAVVRLHKLSGGWPLYVHAVAARTRQLARSAGPITSSMIDVAFQHELFGRNANIGQNCRYLIETASSASGDDLRDVGEAVLYLVARRQPVQRGSIVRRLGRHHSQNRIYRVINRLIDTDFLQEEQGLLSMLDPVFALWLRIEPARRDPIAGLADQRGFQKLLAQYEAQHAQDRQEMGTLFERRIENLVRQFRGQTVDGKLFGQEGEIILPHVQQAGSVRVDDPAGKYGDGPDSYEVDIVAVADSLGASWAIEAKHRRGAITQAMVARFLRNAEAVGRARDFSFGRLWMVAERGVRPDALAAARTAGILTSGLRQVEKLERLLAAGFGAA